MLYGFRQYFEDQTEPISKETGLTELNRLEKTHFLLALPVDYTMALEYLKGEDGLKHVEKQNLVTGSQLQQLCERDQALIIILIPRRWFSKAQLENKGDATAINELLPHGPNWQLPVNYIWGYFAEKEFHRNPKYHAHDGLLKAWRQQYPQEITQKTAKPTPRMLSAYKPQGYQNFHGYQDSIVNNSDGTQKGKETDR